MNGDPGRFRPGIGTAAAWMRPYFVAPCSRNTLATAACLRASAKLSTDIPGLTWSFGLAPWAKASGFRRRHFHADC